MTRSVAYGMRANWLTPHPTMFGQDVSGHERKTTQARYVDLRHLPFDKGVTPSFCERKLAGMPHRA
jgi:hypothetical protein